MGNEVMNVLLILLGAGKRAIEQRKALNGLQVLKSTSDGTYSV
jgi:hypothetical protein